MTNAIRVAAVKLAQAGVPSARIDAEVLLAHVMGKDRVWIITHGDETPEAGQQTLYDRIIERRARREPLQYIIGRQEFWGLEFTVTPDVLIPRPETELVVESALAILRQCASPPTVIDLCTGSGCIAVSIAKEMNSARIFACDKSENALAVARENARRHGVSELTRFFQGDLFAPFVHTNLHERVDVITANPPYIQSGEICALQPEVRDYEPNIALHAGPEGTEIHQQIAAGAPAFLKRNGALIMEMGLGQAEEIRHLLTKTGAYDEIVVLKDLAGIDRVIIAHKI